MLRRLACPAAACLTLAGCATPPPGEPTLAVVTVADAGPAQEAVQVIVLAIDGVVPDRAGAARMDSGHRPDLTPGVAIYSPLPRPLRTDFTVAPGERRIDAAFVIRFAGVLPAALATGRDGPRAQRIVIDAAAGCHYTIAARLTLLPQRGLGAEVVRVQPLPGRFGLPAAGACPRPSQVPIRLE